MKRWIIFAIVLCLLFGLSACASYTLNEHGLPVISSNLRNKLNKALKEQRGDFRYTESYLEAWGSEEEYEAYEPGRLQPMIRYYGNHEGYDIVIYDNPTVTWDGIGYVIAGGYMFEHGDTPAIVGYKDGVIYDLDELYKNGEISKESMAKIYQYYEAFNEFFRSRAD